MDILNKIASIEKLESLDQAQKSRHHWCAHEDDNTKFFHATLKQKRKKLVVSGVTSNGMWITNPTHVKNTFLDFFSSMFNAFNGISISQPSPHLRSLTSTQIDFLSSDFSELEIKDAVCLAIKQSKVERLASGTGYSASSLPFTYLGLPVGVNKKNKASWCPVINKENLSAQQQTRKVKMIMEVIILSIVLAIWRDIELGNGGVIQEMVKRLALMETLSNLSLDSNPDYWTWKADTSKKFTVQNARRIIDNHSLPS
nr:RNA-directed DNA polymerase, eukaryota, reverse transcriptase zinc-binding domain protein [Tanacetum cinerariifolium]